MIHPVSMSTIPNKSPHIMYRQNVPEQAVMASYSDVNTDYYEQEKIRLMKTGITVLGCIGAVIAFTHGISAISEMLKSSAKNAARTKRTKSPTRRTPDRRRRTQIPVKRLKSPEMRSTL